uniref:GPI ethanolamine phosphate transferase 2 n=1 Tax=Strongyloides stercoralis TaxID=6248 RepID=A0AAF5D441_STRER
MTHNETIEYFKKECNKYKNLSDNKSKRKIIFILVDGLAFRFVSNTTSSIKMEKVKKLLSLGSFTLYKSLCSYPTFTLSGMKRLFTGRDASFMDSIFNLGSSIISGDTLFKKLEENGKKILSLGDYLIFSWFPNILTKDSVKTITTTDLQYFNDVDLTTGNHIDYVMKEKYFNWDFLLIYFVGLDQAGHFLNNDKGELIKKKIDELDEYIFKIYNEMSSKNESYIIIVSGDHGMTSLGNHGGSEKEEIESGFLISIKDEVFINNNDTNEINQLDITPTILNFYGIETTNDSIGIANDFTSNLYEKMYLIVINLKHFILNFNLDKKMLYQAEKCINLMLNEVITKCENKNKINIRKLIKCEEIVKKLQKSFLLNIPTPNYILVYFAFVLALIGISCYIFNEIENLNRFNVIFFIIISLLFIGSSFIDEASDVWFFLLQTFLVLKIIQFKDSVKMFNTFKIMFLCSIMHNLMQHVRRRYLIPQNNPYIIGKGPLLNEAAFFFNGNLLTFSSLDLSVTSVALIHDNLLSMSLRLFIHTFSSYIIIYGYFW